MTRIFAVLIVVAGYSSYAMEWYQGSVVLASGDVLTGEISRQSHDLVLVRSSGSITVLPAHKVSSFRFYDAKEHINRRFISQRLGSRLLHNEFFESVVVGHISVFRQQRAFSESFNEDNPALYTFYTFESDKLTRMREFRHYYYPNIMEVLDQHQLDVHALNPNVLGDILELIRLYNQLGPAVPIAAM